jgi:uncharacterized cupin superfamily protein
VSTRSAPIVHFKAHKSTVCGRPDDRRDPVVSSWRDVTCDACLTASFVEVVVGRWRVFAPERTAAEVTLVLEGVAALVERGRSPVELRPTVRLLPTTSLEARLPGDADMRDIRVRRYCAPRSSPDRRPV